MSLQQFIEENAERYAELRRDLHQHPEVGFEETRISDIVAECLAALGYEVTRGMGKSGVVDTLRADMDALPMEEHSGKPWSSTLPGRFHGCGHDGHTATLLFAAEYLAKTRNFDGMLHLIFQPGEELLCGGKQMLDDGVFDRFACDAIFALHNMPGLVKNIFHFRKGAMLSSCDTLQIDVTGVGGHGAMPEKSIDSVVVACYIVTALQTIVSRNITPFQPAVITIGSIQSGTVANIITGSATLKLSVRTLDPDVRKQVLARINDVAKSFGASAEVHHINGSPVLMNDSAMTDFAIGVARDLFPAEKICAEAAPMMASEDFALMLEANPNGCYLFVSAGEGCSVHNPGYDSNDEIMKPAAQYWVTLTERFLK